MSGVGQPFLPRPQFHSQNPHWIDKSRIWSFMRSGIRPRNTGHDFLYASTWELWQRDVVGARFVREAMQRSFWINLKFSKLKYKEIDRNAKAA